MMVRLLVASGLTNAYRSVLSAAGSPAMSGASRWLDAKTPETDDAAMRRAPAMPTALDRVDKSISPLSMVRVSDLPEAPRGPGAAERVATTIRAVVADAQATGRWMNRRRAGSVGQRIEDATRLRGP